MQCIWFWISSMWVQRHLWWPMCKKSPTKRLVFRVSNFIYFFSTLLRPIFVHPAWNQCDALWKRFGPPTRGAAEITLLSGELKRQKGVCDQCWIAQLRAHPFLYLLEIIDIGSFCHLSFGQVHRGYTSRILGLQPVGLPGKSHVVHHCQL